MGRLPRRELVQPNGSFLSGGLPDGYADSYHTDSSNLHVRRVMQTYNNEDNSIVIRVFLQLDEEGTTYGTVEHTVRRVAMSTLWYAVSAECFTTPILSAHALTLLQRRMRTLLRFSPPSVHLFERSS